MYLAAPSHWLMRMAEESGLSDRVAGTRVIPNGVDTSVFTLGDRTAARARLGLPPDALMVVFAALSASTSPFKGFETLTEALSLIARDADDSGHLLVALGDDAPEAAAAARRGGQPIRFVPFAEDPVVVANHYRSADLYLHPARAESFGLAVLEAMACGTPVVASDVGMPSIVSCTFAFANAAVVGSRTTPVIALPALTVRFIPGSQLVTSLGAKPAKIGHSAEFFQDDIESKPAKRSIEVGVDRSLTVSRDALEVLLGSAFPGTRRIEHEVILAAASGTSESAYALPVEQIIQVEADGEKLEFRSSILRVGNELPPADLVSIPTGARLVVSRMIAVQRELEQFDHPPLPPPRKP